MSSDTPAYVFECTDSQRATVLDLLGQNEDAANLACGLYDCLDPARCAIQYLGRETALLRDATDNSAPAEVALGLDVAFLLFSAYLVFMMQLGFAMLCAGSIRSKNCMNILTKNVLDSCVGAIGYYLFGYAFAFGHHPNTPSNGYIGNWNFALSYTTMASRDDSALAYDGFPGQGWHQFFFQWSFNAAATTIVSGAVAERCTFISYLGYAFFISSFVYPVIVHWVWSADGWLSAFNMGNGGYAKILGTGAIDFAGSGVVHMVGGWAALMGAYIIGPRVGRYDASGKVNDMRGHSATLVVMGTFILWFGWYGFNPGSNLIISSKTSAEIVSRVAVITTMGPAAAGVTILFYKYIMTRTWDTVAVCNGILAGLVSITAGCAVIEPWAAVIAGGVGAIIFHLAEHLALHRLKIDDPVSAWALHGGCGAWGVLFVGLLAKPFYVEQVYGAVGLGDDVRSSHKYGILYGGHGQLLLCQFIEVLAIIAWTCTMMAGFFYAAHKAHLLRVPVEQELSGLDVSKHGGSAYHGDGEHTTNSMHSKSGPVTTVKVVSPMAHEGARATQVVPL